MYVSSQNLVQVATVLECGSFTRAAERLNTTQPTLSRAIATLEARLGHVLFQRSRHGVKATEAGRRLARQGASVLDALAAAQRSLRELQDGFPHEVRIGIGPVVAVGEASEVLADLAAAFADTIFRISCGAPDRLLYRLLAEEMDFIVAATDPAEMDGRVESRVLCDDGYGVFCRPRHPLTALDRDAAMRELPRAEWVMMDTIPAEIDTIFAGLGLAAPRARIHFSGEILGPLRLIQTSDHLGILPLRLSHHPLLAGAVTKLDVPFASPRRDIALCYRNAKTLDPRVLATVDAFETAFRRRSSA